MTIASSTPSFLPQAQAEGSLHLLGGVDVGGLDILLPCGVYALVPQSPPARFPLCSGFLKAAVASGRICHVLLRTDPSGFLDRLEQSGWPQVREAWHDESLRVYPMADGFSKLLFRRDVEGLTTELTRWGVASDDILLVDAGDELLSLHDLFMATGQLIKIRHWAREQKVSMLLNFALAGAGSGMASLTGLMDHFSGLARLHSDSEGPVVTLNYWQSEWGTVAERTVLLASEAGALHVRPATHSFTNTSSQSVTTNLGGSETAAPSDQQKAITEVSDHRPVKLSFFIDDAMWGRELRMLTRADWQSFRSIADIRIAAKEVTISQIVLSFSQNTLLSDLARNIHFLRAEMHTQTHIVVAEHRMSLRYANELMLMKLGADAIIRQDVSLERWPDLLQSLKSQAPRSFEKVDVDIALASASSSKKKGVLELPHFVAEVQSTVEKAQVLGVPFAMGVLRSKHVDIRSALLKAVNIRRAGDFLTTDGTDIFIFFYACSLTMAPKVLAGLFDGKMTSHVNNIDWMTSERDIHSLIADLREKQTTYEVRAQLHAASSSEEVACQADGVASQITSSATDDFVEASTDETFALEETPMDSDSIQDLPALAPGTEDCAPRPTVPASLPSKPSISEMAALAIPASDRGAVPTLSIYKLAEREREPSSAHPPKYLPDQLLIDRRNRTANTADDNHLVAERRVAELIRRVALPAKVREAPKKNTDQQRISELIRRLAVPAKARDEIKRNTGDHDQS